ncbi:MAG TPA: hypothetical protein VHZ07_16080 [Bryobacteraceae bacterium]|jgi:ABC-2 type transport system permease protein|nr:hypothetical protein [Bryobacteraceae bacterium]
MWQQIRTLAWVHFRSMRNRFPRTGWGTILIWFLSLIWYGLFAGLGALLAFAIPVVGLATLRMAVPLALIAILVYWQVFPLATLSGGWSLQMGKLRVYPIKLSALFTIEVCLRLTTSPEAIVVLIGAAIGLARHPGIPVISALVLLLFIPLNLFLSIGFREALMRSGRTKRFRELRPLLFILLAIAPQFLARTEARRFLKPYLRVLAAVPATPWREWTILSLGGFSFLAALSVLGWLAIAYFFARWQFAKSLDEDETVSLSPPPTGSRTQKTGILEALWTLPDRLTRDPMAALLQKEFRSLLRMPRFRLIFGLACIFSVLVFIPLVLNGSRVGFIANNFLPIVNIYGLLIMGEVLIFNVFGFDRKAVQIYFITPIPFDTVLKAKNLAALFFILIQSLSVTFVAAILRIRVTPVDLANAVGTALVIAVFLISAGNLTSVYLPRPMDPNQTFRRQTSGKLQLWLLGSFIGLSVPVGFAFLARWAFDSEWAYLAVLLVDLMIGWIIYRLSLDSATQQALRGTEDLVDKLSKGGDPIGT